MTSSLHQLGTNVHAIGFRREGLVRSFAHEATAGAAFGSPCEVPKPVRIALVEFVDVSLSSKQSSKARYHTKTAYFGDYDIL